MSEEAGRVGKLTWAAIALMAKRITRRQSHGARQPASHEARRD